MSFVAFHYKEKQAAKKEGIVEKEGRECTEKTHGESNRPIVLVRKGVAKGRERKTYLRQGQTT